ncbi:MAG: hypothetical protein AAFR66_03690 [Bacteroidota bacterium]
MKNIFPALIRAVSLIGLFITLIPCFLLFQGSISLDQYYGWVLAGSLIWLVSAPFWINKGTEKTN